MNNKIIAKSFQDIELAYLYSKCSGIIFLSIYEGFGMPIVEGLKFGKPVLTSNIGVMKEIGAEFCHFANPYNIEEMAYKIEELYLRSKIPDIAKVNEEYSWENTVKKYFEVYKKIV